MEADVVSVPTIVTAYVPLGAEEKAAAEADETLPEHARRPDPAVATSNRTRRVLKWRYPRPNSPAKRRPSIERLAGAPPVGRGAPSGRAESVGPLHHPRPPTRVDSVALSQAEALAYTVMVVVTGLAPAITVSGRAKQPLDNAGWLDTAHEIVPLYPFSGVTVTVEGPEPPEGTVVSVADTVKILPGTVRDSQHVEAA